MDATPPGPSGRAARRHHRRRRVRRRVAFTGVVVVVLSGAAAGGYLVVHDGRSGASASPRIHVRSTSTTTTTTTLPPTTTTAPHDPRRGSGQPVTFAFAGDTHFEAGLRAKVLADPNGGFLAPIAPVLSGADLAMVNLETSVAETGTPLVKQYVFHAPIAAFSALRGAGVDVVTMANNHGTDYGQAGLDQTLAAIKTSQFPVVGIGADLDQALTPYRTVVKGQRITIFGASQVIDGQVATATQGGVADARDPTALVAAIQAARADSDTIVVYLHWGVEGDTCPGAGPRATAQRLIDAGADVVVGSHSHRQEGAGHLGTGFVDYGLGNFIWYNEAGVSGDSGVLLLTVTGRDTDGSQWVPARIQGGVPTPLGGPAADRAVAAWDGLRACAGLAP
ncbi:MAG TPA: CapA family protein [Acidimicrobiia bacterium]|nr:CapA family protein [Acidimicrobiia bacterium]